MANKRGEKSGMTLYWIAEVHSSRTEVRVTRFLNHTWSKLEILDLDLGNVST